jgi:hypothetical protein
MVRIRFPPAVSPRTSGSGRGLPLAGATDAAAAQLYRTMAANAGRYRTEGDKWFITPEVHSAPAIVGKELTGTFEIKGDRLEAKQAPIVSPLYGKQVVSTYVWERMKRPCG